MAAFAGVIAGVLVAFGAWWGVSFLLVPVLGWAGGRGWPLLACALAAAVVGGVRERMWWHEPDRLQAWRGAIVTVEGSWDGEFLHLADPPARVAVSPRPKLRPGWVRVRGRLDAPGGRRNPGGFDYAFWLRARDVRNVVYAAKVLDARPEGGVRDWFRRGLRAGVGAREAALIEAVELGDRSVVQDLEARDGMTVRDAFARAGVAHVMALSGQNVALLVGVMAFVLARSRVGLARYGVMIALLLGYLWLVGAGPSITRAVIQGVAVLLGLWVGRGRVDVLAALGWAGLVSVLWAPGWVFDVGFQLSYLAVLGLTLTPRLEARLPQWWPRWLRLGVAGTVLAEAATLPVIASQFGQVPVVGVVANLLVAPVMMVLVPLGFLAGLLGPLAVCVNWLTGWVAGALLWLVSWLGSAPVVAWGSVSPAGWVAYAVFAGAGVLWLRRRVRAWQFVLVAFTCVLATGMPGRTQAPREIVFLDVGQGDATLIRVGDFSMLIDGGGTPRGDFDVGARTVLPALRSLGVHDIDVMVATHADADHVEGLASVLRGMPVGELWIGRRVPDNAVLEDVLGAARERSVPVREVRRGDALRVNGAVFTVLWPSGAPWGRADNEDSVAVHLQVKSFSAAFLGDLPVGTEARLDVGRLDVLKVAHHGSRFSTGDELLQETRPRDAVVSVGRNTYGHPSADVLARLRAHGVRVWRTDESGAIRWPLP